MMVGTTIASMMKTESTRIVLFAAATGPCGSSRFIGKPLAVGKPPGRSVTQKTPWQQTQSYEVGSCAAAGLCACMHFP
ncbi:hypothetical protein ACVWXO_010555 [Bradyrhizobium sp. LM2.7]